MKKKLSLALFVTLPLITTPAWPGALFTPTNTLPYLFKGKTIKAACIYLLDTGSTVTIPGYDTTKQIISSINLGNCQQSHVAGNDSYSDYFSLSDAFIKANFGAETARQESIEDGAHREGFGYSYYGTTKNHIDVLLTNDYSGGTDEGIEDLLLLKRSKQTALTITNNNTLISQSITNLSVVANYTTTNSNNGLGVHSIKIVGNKIIIFKYNKKIPYRQPRNLPDEKITIDLSVLTDNQ